MKNIYLLLICCLSINCSSDDKAINIVTEQIERGAVLRNVQRISKDFIHQDFDSSFSLLIEEQDLEDGGLLDFVRIYISYQDQNESNGINSTNELIVRDIPKSDFFIGEFGLPRTMIDLSYQDAIETLEINSEMILPGDQFALRLEIHLTDGRTFSTDTGSASILTDFCFFKSPYRYVISVIEPMADDFYTGTYSYSLVSGNAINSDPAEGIATLSSNEFSNTRIVGFNFSEPVELTFAGSNIYPKIYQSVNGFCRDSQFHILSGPATNTFGQFALPDDTVFFVDIVIGFEGWNGGGAERLLRYKFTKQ